ncbi:MAG TPA: hypothetical protein VKZ85_16185 [Woeseiaceae bacterium]|nr:hypothetical protein [Woeseiaceae bacterium]
MAEPVIALQLNEGTEQAPSWATIETAARWVGPDAEEGDLTDPFPAPPGDDDDAFFDNAAPPNDGELWHDGAAADAQVATAGRNTNQNVLRALETGGQDGTADPPELSAYDDATDAANRTAPTVWLLVGTAGTSNVSCIRAVETTGGAPGSGWTQQTHDAPPGEGAALSGNASKVTCGTALAPSGSKTFNLAACAPHDATPGLTTFVYALTYSYV